jgi:three-Cys-motif partner protein
MSRDIHKKPFDEGTKAKLAIFRDYLREWLPVFIAKKEIYWNTINIFDFFSGPGSDGFGNNGTPLIILDELQPHFENIISKKLNVNLYFNEYDKQKYETLKSTIIQEEEDLHPYSIEIDNLDFKIAFENKFPKMGNKGNTNLLFLDQTGVKHINEEIFTKITNLKQTDFLFFISSSTIKRFAEHPSISQHIKLDAQEIEKTPYHKIHRLVLEYYKSLIPPNKEYYLASFSLKKNAGLYGLIFGSGHVLGIEKFLTTCWNIDPDRGEANFDIDDDKIQKGQFDLFTNEVKKPKKVDLFEKELREYILNGTLSNDKLIYLFTITNGFLPSHCKKIITQLTKENKIQKSNFNLSTKICKLNSIITPVKLI